MNEKEEVAYEQGARMAWLQMLQTGLQHLGYDDPESRKLAWVTEREGAIHALRGLCREVGDNEWSEDLHLADIIEKHLAQHVLAGGE